MTRLLGRGRADDTEDIIRHRQRIYRSRTTPLLDYYADILLTVHAAGSVTEVAEGVRLALKERHLPLGRADLN